MQDKITTIQIMVQFTKELFGRFLAEGQEVDGMIAFSKKPSQETWDSAEADILASAIMFMHDFKQDEYKSCLHERERIKMFVEAYDELKKGRKRIKS